jgi:hypothetical protein
MESKSKTIYIRANNRIRKIPVIFDESDAKKYENLKLHYSDLHGLYRLKNRKRVYIAREILGLTAAWTRVKFASANKLDMRKRNLTVSSVPPTRRGLYRVHIPATASN